MLKKISVGLFIINLELYLVEIENIILVCVSRVMVKALVRDQPDQMNVSLCVSFY